MIRDRLRALRDRLRERKPSQGEWAPEPTLGLGTKELAPGLELERSALVDLQSLRHGLHRPGRLVLTHHWATWAPAVETDIPILLELHLSWAQHVDFIGVGWELMSGRTPVEEAALAVDDFHRSFGLTWRTLIVKADRTAMREALQVRTEMLPQTFLRDRQGQLAWGQEGALDEEAGLRLEAVIRGLTGVVDRPRVGFT